MAQLKWADSLHGMLDLGHRLHSMPAVVDMSHMIRCRDTSTTQAHSLALSGPMHIMLQLIYCCGLLYMANFKPPQVEHTNALGLSMAAYILLSACRQPLDLPEAQKMLVLQLMLKNADLGHLSHPFALHKVPQSSSTHEPFGLWAHPHPMDMAPYSTCNREHAIMYSFQL